MIAKLNSERGMSLVDTLMAVAVLGIAIVVFIAGLSTGTLSTSKVDKLATSHELARSQLEHTKSQTYVDAPHTYPSVGAPAGYTVTSEATDIPSSDSSIQLITVEVSDAASAIYTLEGFKVDR